MIKHETRFKHKHRIKWSSFFRLTACGDEINGRLPSISENSPRVLGIFCLSITQIAVLPPKQVRTFLRTAFNLINLAQLLFYLLPHSRLQHNTLHSRATQIQNFAATDGQTDKQTKSRRVRMIVPVIGRLLSRSFSWPLSSFRQPFYY